MFAVRYWVAGTHESCADEGLERGWHVVKCKDEQSAKDMCSLAYKAKTIYPMVYEQEDIDGLVGAVHEDGDEHVEKLRQRWLRN